MSAVIADMLRDMGHGWLAALVDSIAPVAAILAIAVAAVLLGKFLKRWSDLRDLHQYIDEVLPEPERNARQIRLEEWELDCGTGYEFAPGRYRCPICGNFHPTSIGVGTTPGHVRTAPDVQ